MYFFLAPTKDTTIYEASQSLNTGLDQIIELSKIYHAGSGNYYSSRALLQFDHTAVPTAATASAVYTLTLYETEVDTPIPTSYDFEIFPSTTYWDEGTGKFVLKTDDSWATWVSASATTAWTNTGSDFTQVSSSLISFTTASGDINVDVTDIMNSWINGEITNHGFVVRLSSSLEDNELEYPDLKFYSRNTHTVFQPKLVVKWDDSVKTGSLSESTADELIVKVKNIRSTYYNDEEIKFKMFIRDKYPSQTFGYSVENLTSSIAISGSYRLIDVESGEMIIPFSDYSKLSYNNTGNYFVINMHGLEPLRYYQLQFKFDNYSTDAMTYVFEEPVRFRVKNR